MSQYRIRPMRRDEVDLALQWAAQEGWNPGLNDAACFHAADPGGFLIGLLDDEPIASISVVRYGDAFGFLGLYIVRPEFRGLGYGLRLWQAGMAHLGQRVVGLDGVVAQQDNYRRSGFELAHRNVRYQTVARQSAMTADGVVPVSPDLQPALIVYDASCFPVGRQPFLRAWLAQPQAHVLALLRHGVVSGYGVIRPCLAGHKIGPLFADDAEGADALLQALMRRAPDGDAVFLDCSQANPASEALALHHGMAPVFETARMYKGPAPVLAQQRVFGISSFELG